VKAHPRIRRRPVQRKSTAQVYVPMAVAWLDPGDELLGNWLTLYEAFFARCHADLRLPIRTSSNTCYPSELDKQEAAATLAVWQEAARS
jgi:hypothetical protein